MACRAAVFNTMMPACCDCTEERRTGALPAAEQACVLAAKGAVCGAEPACIKTFLSNASRHPSGQYLACGMLGESGTSVQLRSASAQATSHGACSTWCSL